MLVNRVRARALAKLFTDGTTDEASGQSVSPGYFMQGAASLNAPPDAHGGLSAPTGSYQAHWTKTGQPGWDAIQDEQKGIAPTIPNALPPAGSGTTVS